MKVGDLVVMPDETVLEGLNPSVGIVVADDYPTNDIRKMKRIGIMWADSDRVDYEPIDWLKVINI